MPASHVAIYLLAGYKQEDETLASCHTKSLLGAGSYVFLFIGSTELQRSGSETQSQTPL
jgi:hypothetical protein